MSDQMPRNDLEQPELGRSTPPPPHRPGLRASAAVALGAVGALAIAAIGVGAYAIGHQGAARPGTIRVDAAATRQVAPNTVSFTVGISARGADAAKALHLDNQRVALLTKELHAIGVPLGGVQTVNISVNPEYANGGGITDYTATNQVSVTLHKLSLASGAISTSFTVGGNGVQFTGPTFSITGDRAIYAQVRAQAARNAKDKAVALAQGAGGSVGAVIAISEQESAPAPSNPLFFDHVFASTNSAKAFPNVPVSAGTQQISVSVSVSFALG
jgi:uncharacterized protein YggE